MKKKILLLLHVVIWFDIRIGYWMITRYADFSCLSCALKHTLTFFSGVGLSILCIRLWTVYFDSYDTLGKKVKGVGQTLFATDTSRL